MEEIGKILADEEDVMISESHESTSLGVTGLSSEGEVLFLYRNEV